MLATTVRLLYYPIVALLLLALLIRAPEARSKRMAVLAWAALLLAIRVSAWLVERLRGPAALLIVPVAAVVVIAWSARAALFPFRLRCRRCGERLPVKRILSDGGDLCERCAASRLGGDAAP